MAIDNRTDSEREAYRAAGAYVRAGISVIPIALDGKKHPWYDRLPQLQEDDRWKGVWREFKDRLPTAEELKAWFDCATPAGIAAVSGKVSGNLECIDFDIDADKIFPQWCALVEDHAPGLVARLTVHKTPRGFHVIYRCPEETLPGNQKLAERPCEPDALETLIETRAEGGYFLCPGSPARCDTQGRRWLHHSGPKLSKIEVITPGERDNLIATGHAFDESVDTGPRIISTTAREKLTPIDDFLQNGPPLMDLLPEGWRLVKTIGAVAHLERPDKEKGSTSATLGFLKDRFGGPMFYAFTSNCSPFPYRKFIDSFGVYVAVQHGGDMKAAFSAIVKDGYGQPTAPEPSKEPPKEEKKKLLEVLKDCDFELFCTPKKESHIVLDVNGALQVWEVGGSDFDDWCADQYFLKTGQGCTENALKEVARVLRCKARRTGAVHPVYTRVARHDGRVYVDLANPAGECLEIDADGWRVITKPPVYFVRKSATFAIATPLPGGSLGQLRELLNIDGESGWQMLIAFMGYAWFGVGEYPILTLTGEHGSAKSTVAEFIKRLLDHNEATLLPVPKDDDGFLFAARVGWVFCVDNVSHLDQVQSDAFCRLSTGGGSARKKLYTDGDVCTTQMMRPSIITTITDLVTSSDMAERCFMVRSLPISEERRISKSLLREQLAATEGFIVGALATAISRALKILPTVCLLKSPRMCDFAIFGEALWRGQGLPPGTFLMALGENTERVNAASIEGSPVAETLLAWFGERESWRGMTSELLMELERAATEGTKKLKSWPKAACFLGRQLDRLVPVLRFQGIEFKREQSGGGGSRSFIFLSKGGKVAPPAPPAPPDFPNW